MATPTSTGQIRPTTTRNPNQDIAYSLMRIACDDIGQQTCALDFLLTAIASIPDAHEPDAELFNGLYYLLSDINEEIKNHVQRASALYKLEREVK